MGTWDGVTAYTLCECRKVRDRSDMDREPELRICTFSLNFGPRPATCWATHV